MPVTIRVSSQGLWGTAVSTNGWLYLPWFGFFKDGGSGWIYHYEHGWMYCVGSTMSDIWFWQSKRDWLWSSSKAYPFIWYNTGAAWLWYYRNTGNGQGGWFYNYGTGHNEWR